MPKISIVVPLYRTPERYLREMLDSVRGQSYQNWELCLSDGSGEDSSIAGILEEYTKKDSRIRVKDNKKQLHISDNTNVALDMATGDYIAFMDHDDLLTPDALYECVAELNEYPDTELIYTDEDKITMDGEEYFFPHFKSDFNPDMLCTTNYFCHLVVVKKELYQAAGKLNGEYDGAQDYDFVLRCVEKTDKIRHIPKILYHWRACEGSTAGSADNKSYIVDAGAKAVRAHYRRMGIEAEVIPTKYPGMYRTKYPVKQTPKISVIIPNKDRDSDGKQFGAHNRLLTYGIGFFISVDMRQNRGIPPFIVFKNSKFFANQVVWLETVMSKAGLVNINHTVMVIVDAYFVIQFIHETGQGIGV